MNRWEISVSGGPIPADDWPKIESVVQPMRDFAAVVQPLYLSVALESGFTLTLTRRADPITPASSRRMARGPLDGE